jgi:hypothetical protein
MNNTVWALPNPSVNMMVEEVAKLCRQLKTIAQNLTDLLLPEWPSSALDITNELHRLREAVDDYSLN